MEDEEELRDIRTISRKRLGDLLDALLESSDDNPSGEETTGDPEKKCHDE